MTVAVAALDLGASSGRAVVGRVAPDELELVVAARFDNEPLTVGGVLHWDILNLYRGLLEGLRHAGPVRSVGIDSWAVDYGLLDGDGRLLGNPIHYRDSRTAGVMDKVVAEVGAAELYRVGDRGRAGLVRSFRLHLLRHVVAGRHGVDRARAQRGQPGRQLHQRDRRRWHRPLPA